MSAGKPRARQQSPALVALVLRECIQPQAAQQATRHVGAVCAWRWDVAVLPAPWTGRLRPHSLTALCSPQVKSVNLSDGEVLSIRGVDDDSLVVLANQTLLVEGQVIRSPTNTISVYFRTFQDEAVGTFQLHYQGRCPPASPSALRGGNVLGCAPRGRCMG